MSFDEKVYGNICVTRGHSIVSFPQEVQDPKTGVTLTVSELLCSICGMSLDTIRTMREKKTRRPRKASEVAPA